MDDAEIIAKAIAYTENRGEPNPSKVKAGKTGEMASIFQYTPATWKNYAQQVLGDANAPLNADTESYVTVEKVKGWLKDGYAPEQIFSMWNAGSGEPNAWKGSFKSGKPSKGMNTKYQVPYDVPGYVKMGMKYLDEFKAEKPQQGQQQQAQGQPQQQTQQKNPQEQKAIDTIASIVTKYAPKQGQSQQQQAPAPMGGGLMQQLTPSSPRA